MAKFWRIKHSKPRCIRQDRHRRRQALRLVRHQVINQHDRPVRRRRPHRDHQSTRRAKRPKPKARNPSQRTTC